MRGIPKRLGTAQDVRNICTALDPYTAKSVLAGLTSGDLERLKMSAKEVGKLKSGLAMAIRAEERRDGKLKVLRQDYEAAGQRVQGLTESYRAAQAQLIGLHVELQAAQLEYARLGTELQNLTPPKKEK